MSKGLKRLLRERAPFLYGIFQWLWRQVRIQADKYRPKKYWQSRLGEYGVNLQGPGRADLSEEENSKLYAQGEKSLGDLLARLNVTFQDDFAEIGPGNGYWARWLSQRGARSYTGYDITDVLFADLQKEFPLFHFKKIDVTHAALSGKHQVLLMIDVTQHIIDETLFKRAMAHCRNAVKPGGHFIVTSWMQPYERFMHNEIKRPYTAYTSEFQGWKSQDPVVFRDKFIFSFTKPR